MPERSHAPVPSPLSEASPEEARAEPTASLPPTPAPDEAPAWYQSWWFWTVVGVAVVGTGLGLGLGLGLEEPSSASNGYRITWGVY